MQKSTKFIQLVTVGLVSASLLGCTSKSTKSGAVGVDREQLLLISPQEMNKGAALAYNDVLEQASDKRKLNTDKFMLNRVKRIANDIIPQTAVFRPDAPSWYWEVNVIDSEQLNAWCMPGGKIAFYSGLIKKLQLTDDEIAAIMGHEIAHALREHGRERASQQMVGSLGMNVLGAVTGMGGASMDLASVAMDVTVMLPNSRTHEMEADHMGVELAARAGYNPYAAINVWKKMAEQKAGGQPPEMLSTHPSHSTRIKDLQRYAKIVEPLFLQARKR